MKNQFRNTFSARRQLNSISLLGKNSFGIANRISFGEGIQRFGAISDDVAKLLIAFSMPI